MGIFSFLNASSLKAEITRQRDDIARLHQQCSAEENQRKETQNQLEQSLQENLDLSEQRGRLQENLAAQERKYEEGKASLLNQLDGERRVLQKKAEKRIQELEDRLDSLGTDLKEKTRQRNKTTEQNVQLAEKLVDLEKRLGETTLDLKEAETQISELEQQKQSLEGDLKRIMGDLNRW